ncbi:uncharacterized protein LOC62_06G008743 [Vanrija pseudolonga]|uniref:Bacteriophage T5 Orf172 DNA-binding domain-containing protein n=1 Tax=Vanrija pseudolonga TaxID=143232 RepID=A0AAF1BLN3_9TREE|nr:hypothetical protein LOC62_06G008743 [Vanrija pseudolonga]
MTQFPRYPLGLYNQPYSDGGYYPANNTPPQPAQLPDQYSVPSWPAPTPAPAPPPVPAPRPRASLPLQHRASEPSLTASMSSLDLRNKPLPPVPITPMPAMAMASGSGSLRRPSQPPPLPERPPPPPYSALPTNTITQAIHGVPAPPPIPPRPREKAEYTPPAAAFGDFPPVPAPSSRLTGTVASSTGASSSSHASTASGSSHASTAASSTSSLPPPPATAKPTSPSKPNPALKQARLHFKPRLSHPSASSQNLSSQAKATTPKGKGKKPAVIDLTGSDDDSYSPSESGSDHRLAPPQTRHQRAHSQPPSSPAAPHTPAPKGKKAAPRLSKPSTPPDAVRCSGFTRSGQPCKRVVKTAAPFLAGRSDSDDEDAERTGRYCKDHAGLVCAVDGFYWRDRKGRSGVWIEFKDYIPADLGQQTQTLLRMTMESALTAKELPGFLYAYELRAKGGKGTAFFKVGRTDNVPRRIGQWTQQCQSHTPTLRDIFPLSGAALKRRPSGPGSLLPGAVKGGVQTARMVPAVKRWERLVHLELADRSASQRGDEYDELRKPCADCGTIHKEIFPLADDGISTYEPVVVEVIERWEKFVRQICASA